MYEFWFYGSYFSRYTRGKSTNWSFSGEPSFDKIASLLFDLSVPVRSHHQSDKSDTQCGSNLSDQISFSLRFFNIKKIVSSKKYFKANVLHLTLSK